MQPQATGSNTLSGIIIFPFVCTSGHPRYFSVFVSVLISSVGLQHRDAFIPETGVQRTPVGSSRAYMSIYPSVSLYFSSYSSYGTASVTLNHAHYLLVEFYPRTAAIISLDSIPLYVSFILCFSLPHFLPVVIWWGFNLPPHSTLLHSTHLLHSTPLHPNPNPTLIPLLPLTPFSSPPPSLCRPVPITAETPLLPAAKWTAHRGPELVASQYTLRPCSASL